MISIILTNAFVSLKDQDPVSSGVESKSQSSSVVVLLNYYYSTSHGLNFSLERQVSTSFVLNPSLHS